MFAAALFAVVFVWMQREPAVARALVPAQRVVTLVLTAAIVISALIDINVVRCRKPGVMD